MPCGHPVKSVASMTKKVAVIPGDGIGEEVMRQAVKVCQTIHDLHLADVEVVKFQYGADQYLKTGITLPDEVIQEFRKKYDALLTGPFGDPRISDRKYLDEMLPRLHSSLGLSVYYYPVRLLHPDLYPLLTGLQDDIRFTIFSYNVEGGDIDSGGVAKTGTPDELALQQFFVTRSTVEALGRTAFEYARARNLKRVVIADRGSGFRYARRLWRNVFEQIAAEFQDVTTTYMGVENLTYSIFRNPGKYDIVVLQNISRDVFSHLGAVIQGGLGLAAVGDLNPGSFGLFRPLHGVVPRFAGKNVANPFGAILCVQLLLEFLGRPKAGKLIEDAVAYCLEHRLTTRDLNGSLGTEEVGDYVCQIIEKLYDGSRQSAAEA